MAKKKSAPPKMLRITLRSSLIGERPKTRATVRGLGLRRLNHAVEHPDTPGLRGMIRKAAHLLEVDELPPPE